MFPFRYIFIRFSSLSLFGVSTVTVTFGVNTLCGYSVTDFFDCNERDGNSITGESYLMSYALVGKVGTTPILPLLSKFAAAYSNITSRMAGIIVSSVYSCSSLRTRLISRINSLRFSFAFLFLSSSVSIFYSSS